MRYLFLFIFLNVQWAEASSYLFLTPNQETLNSCDEMGLVGEFKITKDPNSSGYYLDFDNHKVNTYVTKIDTHTFRTYFMVVFGGYGEKEVKLDLEKMSFIYKDNITYNGEPYILDLCKGNVTEID